MVILQGFISGLIATILFDIFNHSLNYAYNIKKPSWYLLGRYFIGYRQRKYFSNQTKVIGNLIPLLFDTYYLCILQVDELVY